jgi:osmotically-inducible protein OsmY
MSQIGSSVPSNDQTQGDVHLAERVSLALRETGRLPLIDLDVSVCDQLVLLQGRLPTYYLKQLAQATAMAVPGIERVRNLVNVVQRKS